MLSILFSLFIFIKSIYDQIPKFIRPLVNAIVVFTAFYYQRICSLLSIMMLLLSTIGTRLSMTRSMRWRRAQTCSWWPFSNARKVCTRFLISNDNDVVVCAFFICSLKQGRVSNKYHKFDIIRGIVTISIGKYWFWSNANYSSWFFFRGQLRSPDSTALFVHPYYSSSESSNKKTTKTLFLLLVIVVLWVHCWCWSLKLYLPLPYCCEY